MALAPKTSPYFQQLSHVKHGPLNFVLYCARLGRVPFPTWDSDLENVFRYQTTRFRRRPNFNGLNATLELHTLVLQDVLVILEAGGSITSILLKEINMHPSPTSPGQDRHNSEQSTIFVSSRLLPSWKSLHQGRIFESPSLSRYHGTSPLHLT